MIISASYKTDIPAFYGAWLVNRLRSGYCMMRNPMNRRPIRVELSKPHAEGIVFWTKNFRPFMKHVDAVAEMDFPFTVQYTINGYSPNLEHNVVNWEHSVETSHALASRFGPRCVVWRYDTIIFSAETPVDHHLFNFERIAKSLRGATDECVISFMQVYRKTKSNMDKMAERANNPWWDPPISQKKELAKTLHEMAASYGIKLTICSQPDLITVQEPSRCIDAQRLSDVAGRPLFAKTKGNRPGCECAASRDIGDYDTCPHGCVYCYAVRSNELAIRRFREHNPESEYLFDDHQEAVEDTRLQQSLEL